VAFDILDHPICFEYPERTTESAWTLHVPIAMLLIDLLRPALFVELGTHTGLSYCAFCQAVKALGTGTQCSAVDTWQGEAHAGVYGADVLEDLRAHHDPRYHTFSRLIQSTFDDAVASFADGSIDLLHIDGYHTYEVVSHDFYTWLPKMSDRGVVVLHDTNEHERDFGVWKLWDELKLKYPTFEILHGHGLGIAAVGSHLPEGLRGLIEADGPRVAALRRYFHEMGTRIESREEAEHLRVEAEQQKAKIQDYELQLADAEQIQDQELEQQQELAQWQERATIAESTLAALRSSRTIRAISVWWKLKARRKRVGALARTSRTILVSQGPFALAKQLARWTLGKRGHHNHGPDVLSSADYTAWFLRQRAKPSQLKQQRKLAEQFTLRPLISFVVPVYNPEPDVLRDTIASVQAQSYDNWELCFADGNSTAPKVRDVLRRSAEQDPRIHVTFLDKNMGISGNSNEALRMARGEFVALLDHDDLVEPDLLYHAVEALNKAPHADIVYFDEDRASADGKRYEQPLLKPDWSPELLLSNPFPMHSIIRRRLMIDIDGFDSAADGTQDWDLFLRLSERTGNFVHIPRVLYHWRMVAGSAAASPEAKPYVWERQRLAIQRHMQRLGHADAHAFFAAPGILRVVWEPQPAHVSIIIPTRDKVSLLRRCLASILARTSYKDYDIVLVDTGSTEQTTEKYYTSLARDKRITIARYEGEFNYSRVCNYGAKHATGDMLLFLNNDVEVLDKDWLDELVRWASVPEVGVVGAKLVYSDGRIQHAGVIVGMGGVAGHLFYGCHDNSVTLFGSVDWYRNYSAVTGALHMMRRDVFEAVGGYDEAYDISYSDVALCFQATKLGYRVLYDPFVRLIHYESQTRDRAPSLHDTSLAGARLMSMIEAGDPFYNPNLSYFTSTPTLTSANEVSRLKMLERLTGTSAQVAKGE
jgi:GT2 family glycosyltransferase